MRADFVRRCEGILMNGERCQLVISQDAIFCSQCETNNTVHADWLYECAGFDELGEKCGTKVQLFEDYCEPCKTKIERAWQSKLDTYRKELAEALHRHPDACKRCLGTGGRYGGGSYDTPPEWIDCPDCLEEGHCPWCGGKVINLVAPGFPAEMFACEERCSWTGADMGTAVLPEPPEREE